MCNICDTVRLNFLDVRFGALCLVALCLGGCVTKGVPGDWVGASFAELKQSFGTPEAVLINERNNRVYVFRDVPRPDSAETKLTFGDGELVMANANCAILFELAEEVVTRWSWYESGCEEFDFPMPVKPR